jgi:hypothetical protein
MGKSRFSGKKGELRRALIITGLALAGFVTTGEMHGDEYDASSADLTRDRLNVDDDYSNEATFRTQDVLAGVERGGFGFYNAQEDMAWDPLNPWGPNPIEGGGPPDPPEGCTLVAGGWFYGGVFFPYFHGHFAGCGPGHGYYGHGYYAGHFHGGHHSGS